MPSPAGIRDPYIPIKGRLRDLCRILRESSHLSCGDEFQSRWNVSFDDITYQLDVMDEIVENLLDVQTKSRIAEDVLRATVLDFKQREERLINEVETLRKTNAEQASFIVKLNDDKRALQSKNDEATTKIQSNMSTIFTFENDIRASREENQRKTRDLAKLQELKPQLEANILQLSNELAQTTNSLEAKTSEARELNTRVLEADAMRINAVAVARNEAFKERGDQLEEIIERQRRENIELQDELERVRVVVASRDDQLEEQRKYANELTSQLNTAKQDIQSSTLAHQAAIQKIKLQNGQLQTQVESLQEQLVHTKQSHENTLRERDQQLSAEMAGSSKQIDRLNADVSHLKRELISKSQHVTTLETMRDQAQVSAQRSADHISELEHEILSLKKENSNAIGKREEWRRQYESAKLAQDALEEKVKQVQNALTNQTIQIEQLKEPSLNSLKCQAEEGRSASEEARTLRHRLQSQVAEWEHIQNSFQSQILNMSETIQKLTTELNTLRTTESQREDSFKAQCEAYINQQKAWLDQEFMKLETQYRSSIREKSQQISDLERSRDLFKNKHQDVCNELSRTQMELDRANAEIIRCQTLDSRVSELKLSVKSSTDVNQDLMKQLIETQSSLDAANLRLKHLEASSASADNARINYEKELNELRESAARAGVLKVELKGARDDLQSLKVYAESLEKELNEAREQMVIQHTDNESLERHMRDLEQSYIDRVKSMILIMQHDRSLIVRLSFIKKLNESFLPRLDQMFSSDEYPQQRRTLKGAILTVLAVVKFKAAAAQKKARVIEETRQRLIRSY